MMTDARQVLAQIDTILTEVDRAKMAAQYDDYSGGLPDDELGMIAMRLMAVLSRLSYKDSVYYQQSQEINGPNSLKVRDLGAILRALRADVDAGYIQSLSEIAHAEVFVDFIEMADELQQKGYKDAAAVIVGGVLEGHLRELASKAGLSTTKADGFSQKADTLNNELATKASVYNSLQQKSVTAWLALRNDAAHGNYEAYDHRQVATLIHEVRDFMVRHPA
jgi:hypothetical protein